MSQADAATYSHLGITNNTTGLRQGPQREIDDARLQEKQKTAEASRKRVRFLFWGRGRQQIKFFIGSTVVPDDHPYFGQIAETPDGSIKISPDRHTTGFRGISPTDSTTLRLRMLNNGFQGQSSLLSTHSTHAVDIFHVMAGLCYLERSIAARPCEYRPSGVSI